MSTTEPATQEQKKEPDEKVAPPPETPPKEKEAKVKDAWDKAQIVSGFLSAVVIAGVGLLINSGIQRAQIQSSEENTKAQVDVAKYNNDAQLKLTERNAEVQRHLQESTLASQLVEHLASGSALKKQIAIVALRRSVPPEMYQEVIAIVVRSETDPEVRKTALGQAATLPTADASVVQAVTEVATNAGRSPEERGLAADAVQQLGIRSVSPHGTFVLSSSTGRQLSLESDEMAGGVFTHFLLNALMGAASPKKDGSIRLSELSAYVYQRVKEATNGRQSPIFAEPKDAGDLVILGPGYDFSRTVVVAVGNTHYRGDRMRLLYGASDARKVADVFEQHGAVVYRVEDATREKFREAMDLAIKKTDENSLFIFFYAGHSFVDPKGEFWLLPIDVDTDALQLTGIPTWEFMAFLSKVSARASVLFLDTSFSGGVLGQK
jgi:hypothetical protein